MKDILCEVWYCLSYLGNKDDHLRDEGADDQTTGSDAVQERHLVLQEEGQCEADRAQHHDVVETDANLVRVVQRLDLHLQVTEIFTS